MSVVAPFGNFAGADPWTEFKDPSCGKANVKLVDDPELGRCGEFAGPSSTPNCYGNKSDPHTRVAHMNAFAGPGPSVSTGAEVWRCIAVKPMTPAYGETVLDELHQGYDAVYTGPAPFNLYYSDGDTGKPEMTLVFRGDQDGGGFVQWAFGDTKGFVSGGDRPGKEWEGLSNIVQPGEALYLVYGRTLATDLSGWVEAWASWGGPLVPIVPRTSGIATDYPVSNYPMLSLYLLNGLRISPAVQLAVRYGGGFYADSFPAIQDAFAKRYPAQNFWGGPSPTGLVCVTPPTISGPTQVGQVLHVDTGAWTGGPTSFAYQWQWLAPGQTTWGDVTGATMPTFQESDTFSGALIRCKVTASKVGSSVQVTSTPVGPLAPAPQPAGFQVAGTRKGRVATLSWPTVAGVTEWVPTLDGSEYLTDGKRHPIKPGQLTTTISAPDDRPHKFGVRANERIAEDDITL